MIDDATVSETIEDEATASDDEGVDRDDGRRRLLFVDGASGPARALRVRRRTRALTGLAALGGFLFGYDTGVVSGAAPSLRRSMDLDDAELEAVVSCAVAAALASSLVGGAVSDRVGRRGVVLAASWAFTAGSLWMALAGGAASLLAGRVVVGTGVGLASVATPLYLAEAAAVEDRGRLVTVNGLMICGGQFFAGMFDGVVQLVDADEGWRIMLGAAALPSLLMWLGFVFFRLPESPRWLVAQGRVEEAREVLRSLRISDDVAEEELNDIVRVVHHTETSGARRSSNENDASLLRNVQRMLSHPPTCRALKLGCGIMLLQQLSGINTVMYYAASIYQMAGYKEQTAVWLSGFTALAQLTGVVVSLRLVERRGRRPLVLASLASVALSLTGLGTSFFLGRAADGRVAVASFDDVCARSVPVRCRDCVSSPDCGYCEGACFPGDEDGPDASSSFCPEGSTWRYDDCEDDDDGPYGPWSVLFMVTYLFGFGVAMGPLPWTITSEIYPLQHRSLAVGLSTATNWIGNFVVSSTFLTISDPSVLDAYGAFWLYAAVAVVGFVWLYVRLPESKGLSLEEIEALFQRPEDSDLTVDNDDDDDDDDGR